MPRTKSKGPHSPAARAKAAATRARNRREKKARAALSLDEIPDRPTRQQRALSGNDMVQLPVQLLELALKLLKKKREA